jgi:hypothetical protein
MQIFDPDLNEFTDSRAGVEQHLHEKPTPA